MSLLIPKEQHFITVCSLNHFSWAVSIASVSLKFFFKIVFPLPRSKEMLEVTLISVFFNTLCTLSLLLPVSPYLHITNLTESSYKMA